MENISAKVSTQSKIDYNDSDHRTSHSIRLVFELPGGMAVYDVPSTKDQNESIEAANTLMAKKAKR